MNKRQFLQFTISTILSSHINSQLSKVNKNKKRVLVLGGTGFLGPIIVNELINRGHQVTLLNRGKTNPNLFPQIETIIADRELENRKGLSALINNNQQWDWAVDTWQNSALAVIDAAHLLKDRVANYQYVSTISVYDDWHQTNIKEDAPLNPIPPLPKTFKEAHRYAIRKTQSESALKEIFGNRYSSFRSHGLRGITKRTNESSEPYWPVKVMRGGPVVMPAAAEFYQVTDMISLAKFMVHCGEKNHQGTFNVAYKPFSFKGFVQNIKKLSNSDAQFHWLSQEFLEQNDAIIYRTNRAGRYQFNIDKAIVHGLCNRSINLLIADQLKGYISRNPSDDYMFGKPGSHSLSKEQELRLIKLWNNNVS